MADEADPEAGQDAGARPKPGKIPVVVRGLSPEAESELTTRHGFEVVRRMRRIGVIEGLIPPHERDAVNAVTKGVLGPVVVETQWDVSSALTGDAGRPAIHPPAPGTAPPLGFGGAR